MLRNLNIRAYFSVPWIRYTTWTILIILGIALIALLANYLTMVVFNL